VVNKKIIGLGIIAIIAVSSVSILLFLPKPTTRNLWIEDPTFDTSVGSPWKDTESGDTSDIQGNIATGQANFQILGESREFDEISKIPNSSTSLGWQKFRNENFQYPQKAIINSSGLYASHIWDEVEFGGLNQTKNYPSVHFRNTVSMPVNMEDYVIDSASLDVIFNASVGTNIDTPNDDYEGTQDEDVFAIGDFVIFYVLISDVNYTNSYTVGYNKTKYLGQYGNGNPSILSIPDSPLATVEETDLIRALNAAFEKDINHSKFIISLCIDIFSEDNDNSGDHDDWKALVINECNLTFSYKKTINQFTTFSFSQSGKQISGSNFQIVSSNLNFKYKIDKSWPTGAPLSELKIYINEKLYTGDKFKISSMNSTFQEAKIGGFDVNDYLEKDMNISVTFEVDLKDTFELEEIITISIDDLYLYIELKEIVEDLSYLVYILGGAFGGLMIFFVIYEKYLKYPKTVRKVRKLRKSIRKDKKVSKSIIVRKRNDLIDEKLNQNTAMLNLQPSVKSKTEKVKNLQIKNSKAMKKNEEVL